MNRTIKQLCLVFLVIFVPGIQWLSAQTFTSNTRIAGWLFYPRSGISDLSFGTVAIPDAMLNFDDIFDLRAAAKLSYFRPAGEDKDISDLELYRLWLRHSAANYEIRVGWQKLNFGPAMLLRPLMWFEQLDARDPLQLSAGVPALRIRYYWQNNANAWLWLLPASDSVRGWELLHSKKNTIEFGGRMQFPLWSGELAFTLHNRNVSLPSSGDKTETRLGLDGRWDYEIGMWFEQSMGIIHSSGDLPMIDNKLTLGADYTFSIGNGLHVLTEVMWWKQSELAPSDGATIRLHGLLMDYGVGLYDRLALILFYEARSRYWLRYLSWTQTYDDWVVYLNVFWNSKTSAGLPGSEPTVNTGSGLQILAEFTF